MFCDIEKVGFVERSQWEQSADCQRALFAESFASAGALELSLRFQAGTHRGGSVEKDHLSGGALGAWWQHWGPGPCARIGLYLDYAAL